MKIFITFIFTLLHLSVSADVCQKLILDDVSNDYEVYASASKGLHINFYEDLTFSILSNDVLWKTHSNPNMKSHFWLFSKNMSTDDNRVGITFIMESGRAINLVVQQKLESPSCLVVQNTNTKPLVAADFSSSKSFEPLDSKPLITSSYSFDKSLVMSAFDDQRFTHIQLNGFSSGHSLYSVIAISNNKKQVISNPVFDEMTNTYSFPGIHDQLLFEGDSGSFTVTRL